MNLRLWASVLLTAIFGLMTLQRSVVAPKDETERVRTFTRMVEFDYASWMLNALVVKTQQGALGVPNFLDPEAGAELVRDYMELLHEIFAVEREIQLIYSDPAITDPAGVSAELRARLDALHDRQRVQSPIAEAVLQAQVASVLKAFSLTLGGQPLPPVLYQGTSVPMALIVSPRHEIRQQNNISVLPGLTLEEQIDMEDQVARTLDLSALIVPIGGVGTYPTMVYETTNLNWLAEVVAHEWIHNYLTLRPLGMNYMTSPILRTINETTANLAGKEIGAIVIERYYPDLVPPPPPPPQPPPPDTGEPAPPPEPPRFDFRAAMRETRVTAEELLAAGEFEEAEAYMESRRQVFWDEGYRIRKLNQAYFAFYGAYASTPGGCAAGADPVGPAVVALRERSASLAEFINRISWITSYEALLALLAE